jgi:hypothetical protein
MAVDDSAAEHDEGRDEVECQNRRDRKPRQRSNEDDVDLLVSVDSPVVDLQETRAASTVSLSLPQQ